MKFPLQYPVDQRVDQKLDQRLAKSHLPGQHLDIALEAGQYTLSRVLLALTVYQLIHYPGMG